MLCFSVSGYTQSSSNLLNGILPLLLDCSGSNCPVDIRSRHRTVFYNTPPLNPPNGYWEYLPEDYDDPAESPLLIFYHGIAQNGDGSSDLGLLLRHGPPRLINENNWDNEYPFVVLSPQHNGLFCPSANEVNNFIQFAKTQYDIDEQRIYLTGLSCGAIGIWSYLGNFLNNDVAAAVPIAGNGVSAWNSRGCDLTAINICAFHGDADPTVPVSGTNVPMDGMAACDPGTGEQIKTIYPGVEHDSWTQTYDGSAGHDIYEWMLGKSLPVP